MAPWPVQNRLIHRVGKFIIQMNSLQMTSSRPPKQISRRTTLSNRSRNLADKLVYYIWQLRSELLSETGTRARHSVAAFRDIISNLPRIGLYHGGTPWTRQRDRLPFCCLPATQAERWSGIHSAASPLIPSRHTPASTCFIGQCLSVLQSYKTSSK